MVLIHKQRQASHQIILALQSIRFILEARGLVLSLKEGDIGPAFEHGELLEGLVVRPN